MTTREETYARQIRFTSDDFEPLFAQEGVDFHSLTDAEWRSFENMFIEGTAWSSVAQEAAWVIKADREVDEM